MNNTITIMTAFGPVEAGPNASLHPKAVKLVEPDRDDLHARIVTTLQRHGHLNTYELADAIVAAVVEGSRS